MNRTRCPLCRLPLANRAAHVPTPELHDPLRDAAVYWCAGSDRHVTVPLGWDDGFRRAVRRGSSPPREPIMNSRPRDLLAFALLALVVVLASARRLRR